MTFLESKFAYLPGDAPSVLIESHWKGSTRALGELLIWSHEFCTDSKSNCQMFDMGPSLISLPPKMKSLKKRWKMVRNFGHVDGYLFMCHLLVLKDE